MKPNKLLFKNENKENMKSLEEDCQVLKLKLIHPGCYEGLKSKSSNPS